MTDLRNNFLIEFIEINETWLNAYAELFYEKIQDNQDRDYDKYSTLWHSKHYIKYFDRIFDKVVENSDKLYEWRLADALKNVLVGQQGDDEVSRRQEAWVLHYYRKI